MNTAVERQDVHVEDPSAIRRIVEYATVRILSRQLPGLYQQRGPPPYNPYQERQPSATEFGGIIPALFNAIRVLAISGILFVVSLTTYLAIYRVSMPTVYATEPLHFDYTGLSAPPVLHQDDTVTVTSSSPMPWAHVDLFAKHSPWEAAESTVIPPPLFTERILDAKHAHYVELSIRLPETSLNRNLGMFGLVVSLQNRDGSILAVSRRSVRIPHESPWISVVRKTLLLLPLVAGGMEESRTLTISSFRHFVEAEAHPLRYISVQVTQLDGRAPEITGGEVRIGKELNDIQEFLNTWFYLCATIGTSVIAGFYILFWHGCQTLIGMWLFEEPDCELDLDSLDANDEGETVQEATFTHSQQNTSASVVSEGTDRGLSYAEMPLEDDDDPAAWEDLRFR